MLLWTATMDQPAYGQLEATPAPSPLAATAQLDTGVAPEVQQRRQDLRQLSGTTFLSPLRHNFSRGPRLPAAQVDSPETTSTAATCFYTMRADNLSFAPFLLRRSGNVLSLQHSTGGADWAAITWAAFRTTNPTFVALVDMARA